MHNIYQFRKNLPQYLSLSEEDLQLVQVMRTGRVVAGAWPTEESLTVEQHQLVSSETRAALLSTLITQITTSQQVQALIDLLKLWPPFGPEVGVLSLLLTFWG